MAKESIRSLYSLSIPLNAGLYLQYSYIVFQNQVETYNYGYSLNNKGYILTY